MPERTVDLFNLEPGEADAFVDEERWERVHPGAGGRGRRIGRGGVFTLNLTAMIDVVFLLLMYFLLSMDFSATERSIATGVPGEGSRTEQADPFALPVQPIVVRVATVRPIDEASSGAYALSVDSPVLRDAALAGGGTALFDRLRAVRGGVLTPEQPIVVLPEGDAAWEHALEVLNGVLDAGYPRARFARPRAEDEGGGA